MLRDIISFLVGSLFGGAFVWAFWPNLVSVDRLHTLYHWLNDNFFHVETVNEKVENKELK